MPSDLRKESFGGFQNFCRMSATDVEYLLNWLGLFIARRDTNMRKDVPIQERLAVTLQFFAPVDSYLIHLIQIPKANCIEMCRWSI